MLIGNGPGADPGTEIRANAWRQLLPLAATGKLTLLPTKTYPSPKPPGPTPSPAKATPTASSYSSPRSEEVGTHIPVAESL